MGYVDDLIRSSVRRAPGRAPITVKRSEMETGITRDGVRSRTMTQANEQTAGMMFSAMRRAPSVQPREPRTAITPITTRAISAPVAPTALGRTFAATSRGGAVTPAASLGVGSGFGGSISNLGDSVTDTIKQFIPITIKAILVVIAIKVLWWLLKGRR